MSPLSRFARLRLALLPLVFLLPLQATPLQAAPAKPKAAAKAPKKAPAKKTRPTPHKPPAHPVHKPAPAGHKLAPAKHSTSHTPGKPAATPVPRPTPRPVPTPVPAPVAEAGPRTFALLVGVGKYSSPLVAGLTFPAQDAQSLREAFVDPRLGAIPQSRVLLLADQDATREAILSSVDTFFKPKMRAGDRMIVFLAGHGIAKGVGLSARSWFLPHDVRGFTTAQLEASAVELKALSDKLGELPASQFALFVDACREDPTPGRGVKVNPLTDVMARSVQVAPQDRAVDSVTLFACSVGQRAYEDPELKHGVFTYAILSALRDPALPRPQGLVDAAVLARYVGEKVDAWAQQLSQSQGADIQQTPEMVSGALSEGVSVLHLQSTSAQSALPPLPSQLAVLSVPDRARVFIDGRPIGLAPLIRVFQPGSIPQGGVVRLRVEATGSAPLERTIKLLPGYSQQVEVDLLGARTVGGVPGAVSTSGASNSSEDPLLQKARDAEERGRPQEAEGNYKLMLDSDAKNATAHEKLAQLRSRQGDWAGAINALAQMNRVLPGAHALSLISRAYSALSLHLAAREGLLEASQRPRRGKVSVQPWLVPATAWECANYGFVAAGEALKADPRSTEALIARGLALVAADENGDKREAALPLLKSARDSEDANADAHYALGLALRVFGQGLPDTQRKPEMLLARQSLARAIELRPDFYEARREMALCAAIMDDREAAMRECDLALAYRGGASDEDEFAALELAMSAWHKSAAEAETDPNKKAAQAGAGDAYLEDAQADSKDKSLSTSAGLIKAMGLSRGNLWSFLPASVQRIAPWVTDPKVVLQNEAQSRAQQAVDKATGGRAGGALGDAIGGIFRRKPRNNK